MTKNFRVDGVGGTYFEAGEIGTFYRMVDGILEYQPMSNNDIDLPKADEWNEVEEDLVGSEPVVYNSTEMTLKEVYQIIKSELE